MSKDTDYILEMDAKKEVTLGKPLVRTAPTTLREPPPSAGSRKLPVQEPDPEDEDYESVAEDRNHLPLDSIFRS